MGETEGGTGNPISGADVCIPSAGGPPVSVMWTAATLGLTPLDDIDALYVDPLVAPSIVFSLDRDSPSLMTITNPVLGTLGADPGDLIHVSLEEIPPTPRVWALATELGIDGDTWEGPWGPGASLDDDDLDALWITDYTLIGETVPVELSLFTQE